MNLFINSLLLCLLCSILVKSDLLTQLSDEELMEMLNRLSQDDDYYDYYEESNVANTQNQNFTPTAAPAPTTTETFQRVALSMEATQSLHNFTFDLFNAVNDQSTSGNIVLSPLSVYSVMLVLRTALRGHSLNEVNRMLGTTSLNNPELGQMLTMIYRNNHGYDLGFINRMYVDKRVPVLKSFVNKLKRLGTGRPRKLDFRLRSNFSRNAINKIVRKYTNNMIEEILPVNAITPDTKVLLVNALSLKATWTTRFIERYTEMQPFHLSSSETIMVPTMNSKSMGCTSRRDNELQTDMVVLPLDDQLSMIFFMPINVGDFSSLLGNEQESMKSKFERLINDIWPAEQNYLRREQLCNIYLPKFSINNNIDMVNSLRTLGVSEIFDSNRGDFSEMTGNESTGLYVTDVRHKAVFGTNEEGIEAAAATTLRVDIRRAPGRRVYINKPFLFAVRQDTSRAILFFGKVTQPSDT